MKNQKNERGITLVALVVTIVVLLILAGITIMYVMQGDSIFSSANKAKTDTNDAVVQEALSVIVSSDLTSQLYTGLDANGATSTLKGDTTENKEAVGTYVTNALKAAGMDATGTAVTCSSYDTTNGITLGGKIFYKEVEYDVTVITKGTSPKLEAKRHVETPAAGGEG